MVDLPRIAIFGATGQVGWELCRTLSVVGEVVPVSRTGADHQQVDLSDFSAVRGLLDVLNPTVIVNAAAYTAVDKAEEEPEAAFQLNAGLPELLGEWAKPRQVPLIHYSTDYVFDGTKAGAYTESDEPNPINVYGESKLAGEQALLSSGANAWILRVSWVYAMRGSNFLLSMKRLMAERDELNIVDDQLGAPTWSRAIAEATLVLLSRVLEGPSYATEKKGIYHLAPSGKVTWFGFARAIREQLGIECRLNPIESAGYPTPAKRPKNSLLDSSKVAEDFGIRLSSWDKSMQQCLNGA